MSSKYLPNCSSCDPSTQVNQPCGVCLKTARRELVLSGVSTGKLITAKVTTRVGRQLVSQCLPEESKYSAPHQFTLLFDEYEGWRLSPIVPVPNMTWRNGSVVETIVTLAVGDQVSIRGKAVFEISFSDPIALDET